jgi:hypothetical protein
MRFFFVVIQECPKEKQAEELNKVLIKNINPNEFFFFILLKQLKDRVERKRERKRENECYTFSCVCKLKFKEK